MDKKNYENKFFDLFVNTFIAALNNKKLVLDVFDNVIEDDENYPLSREWLKKILPEGWRHYSNNLDNYNFDNDDVIQKKVIINYPNLEDVKKVLVEKYNVNEEVVNKNMWDLKKFNLFLDDYFNSVVENNYPEEYFRSAGNVKYIEVPVNDFFESFENIFDVNVEKIRNILKDRIDVQDENIMKILRKFFNEKFHYFDFKDENAQENFLNELSKKTYSITREILSNILNKTNVLEPIEEILFFNTENKVNLLKELDRVADELKIFEDAESVAEIVYAKYFSNI